MTVGTPPTYRFGLDDTDEREYGCTTHDFDSLIRHLSGAGFAIEDPRLVRLWPFAPTRTRGNAALAASVTTEDKVAFESALDDWFNARFSENIPGGKTHSAQPVLLLSESKLPESMYWDTVRNHVELENRIMELEGYPHRIWSTPAGLNGLIGASAAIAWRGLHDCTWECTAWRDRSGPRVVPGELVTELSARFPSTFLNRDPNAGRSLIAPRTPCPVLYGIRGESQQGVLDAHDFLQQNGAEISTGHRAHRSNQATGDHLIASESGSIKSIQVMQGGHVEIDVGKTLLAFSEGGDLNQLAQELVVGDTIEWWGLTNIDESVHLERLRLIEGERNRTRPLCKCGSRYKSQGKGQPLKCPKCKSIHHDVWCSEVKSSDWKEPPPSHRRHLSKPLSRMSNPEG